MILLQQMAALFLMMLIGFYCGKKEVLNEKTSKDISWLVINVANVAMVINSGVSNSRSDIAPGNLLLVFGLALGVYAVLLFLAWVLPVILRVARQERGTYRVMLVFSNIGFMGLPLLSAIAAQEAVLYAAIFIFIFNVLIYTYGILAMTAGEPRVGRDVPSAFPWKKLCNPGVISCLIALILFFMDFELPSFIQTTLSSLSALTGPLSMLVIGRSFLDFKVKDLFLDVRLLLFSLIKLVVIPVIGLSLIKCFVTDTTVLQVALVMLATPVASMVAMMVQQYEGNVSLASRGVALSTLLSVLTLPLVSLITRI